MTSYLHEQPTMNARTIENAISRLDPPDWAAASCRLPIASKNSWKWCLGGDWSIAFHVLAAPNVFQRWLLRALLGIHWERLP